MSQPSSTPNPRPPRSRSLAPALDMAIHLGGVLLVTLVLGFLAIPGTAQLQTLINAAEQSTALGQDLLISAFFHLLLSTVIWFGLAMAVEFLWKRRASQPTPARVVRPARGSIYVEFLAIIPVFMMLLFGLLQLVFLNLGSALTTVASYEAARAAWIWEAEIAENQISGGWGNEPSNDITLDDVEDRVRIATALVMTPIAAGDYSMSNVEVTPEFEAMRHTMTGRFGTVPGTSAEGQAGSAAMDAYTSVNRTASLRRSLDATNIPIRAWRKFTFAYMSTDVIEIIREPDRVGARVAYYQHMSMPFVDAVFGETSHPHNVRGGHYVRWEFEHSFPRQRHSANRLVPNG